ncbi:TetR/AcrR family transcriptional regulator [Isoptericola sp. NPDC056605]|uniref:TetR/AcrR family transcriptional regulator n=1 Tax=Isoptericola sp. NPDC056605 TaxID=3345876 RepID=UPI0036CEB3BE
MTFDLRERAHEVMRAELAEAAFGLIVESGYDGLTADDLARGLGISRPTFYRYLGSKDDVIVTVMLGPDDHFVRPLTMAGTAGRDAATSWWQWLRTAVEPVVVQGEQEPGPMRARLLLVQSQPAVGAKLRRARGPQIDRLAEALAEYGCAPAAAHVLATASVSVLDLCLAQWSKGGDGSLREVVDRAFIDLEDGSAAPVRSTPVR